MAFTYSFLFLSLKLNWHLNLLEMYMELIYNLVILSTQSMWTVTHSWGPLVIVSICKILGASGNGDHLQDRRGPW